MCNFISALADGEGMGPHVVVEGDNAFWELVCVCGELVTESLFHAAADCEECGARVEVDLHAGSD